VISFVGKKCSVHVRSSQLTLRIDSFVRMQHFYDQSEPPGQSTTCCCVVIGVVSKRATRAYKTELKGAQFDYRPSPAFTFYAHCRLRLSSCVIFAFVICLRPKCNSTVFRFYTGFFEGNCRWASAILTGAPPLIPDPCLSG
jgi:hypothetical protein